MLAVIENDASIRSTTECPMSNIECLVNKNPYYSIYNCLMIKVNSKFPIKIAAFKKPDRI